MQGDDSVGEFYSVALTNNHQQADTGTKMIHIGKIQKSTIVSKGISAGKGNNTYRGQVKILPSAENSQNFTQCDSLLIGDQCGAITVPYIEVKNPTAKLEHEASTSKVSDDQLFYLMQRGLDEEEAHHMIITGWSKEVFKELPFEFAVEAGQLLKVNAWRDQLDKILEIKNLNASVAETEEKILNGLNLSIGKGETHAIMGPNGGGKSTSLMLLLAKIHIMLIQAKLNFLMKT